MNQKYYFDREDNTISPVTVLYTGKDSSEVRDDEGNIFDANNSDISLTRESATKKAVAGYLNNILSLVSAI
jgi:hypothetical protein